MARTGRGVRLAPGIHRYDTFIRARAKVRDQQQEKHYPLDEDLDTILVWQLEAKAQLLSTMTPKATRARKRTIASDSERYLAELRGRRQGDERGLLRHWATSRLGRVPRHTITRAQVKAQLQDWADAGVPASSLNHRLRVLRALYRELDGDDAYNPCERIKRRTPPPREARGRPMDLIEAITAYMPDEGRNPSGSVDRGPSLSKARARVMVWTGLPPAVLMQVLPVHFNRQAATLVAQPRRKGKGTKPEVLPLLPQAVDALVQFFAVGAQGAFQTGSFHKAWMAGQRRLERALRARAAQRGQDPSEIVVPHVRPYDIRHSFLTEAYRRSEDLIGVRRLALHAESRTTEQYVEAAADASARNVLAAWQALAVPPEGAPRRRPTPPEQARNRPNAPTRSPRRRRA